MSFEADWGISFEEAVKGLDELSIVEEGRVKLCIGLVCTVYFRKGNDKAQREKVISCFEQYQKEIGEKLIWGRHPTSGLPKKVAGSDVANLRKWVPKVALEEPLDLIFHGGQDVDDANHYSVRALVQQLYPDYISYFSVALPLSWVASKPQGAFTQLVVDFSDKLKAFHGYAGLGIIIHGNDYRNPEIIKNVRVFATRFKGLEVDFPHNHARNTEHAIKGVNWLTVLQDCWFEKLGGVEKLKSEIGSDFVFHAYTGGQVIQAGPHPQFGDVNRAQELPLYKELSSALKPIRVQDYPWSFAGGRQFTKEQAQQWLARFD
jgi:hypothetical protein